MKTNRKATHPIQELILHRWSPRAMSGEPMSDAELMPLFEAARWAPSSYNAQQWRFIYAKRDTSAWDILFNLLVPFNQSWAQKAAALVVIISRKNFEYNNAPSRTHSFDAGAACENLALQAASQNLVAHVMEGFDYDRARKDLKVPDDYDVEAMVAIGRPGNVSELPQELREREVPSERKPLSEILFEGFYNQN